MALQAPVQPLRRPNVERIASEYETMAQSSQNIANEVRMINDLPAFDQGEAILGRFIEEIRGFENRLTGRMDEVNRSISTRIDVAEHNNFARLTNCNAAGGQTNPLIPLKTRSGEDVPGFPATVGDIDLIPEDVLAGVMAAYGIAVQENGMVNRFYFRRYIGIY